MQLVEKGRIRKRNEQKMAERLAAQLTEVGVDHAKKELWIMTGRILDMVEKQGQHKEKLEEKGIRILQMIKIWRVSEVIIGKRRETQTAPSS